MFRSIRNLIRLAAIGRALARNRALFIIEGAGPLIWFVRLIPVRTNRDAQNLPPGQRLALALQEMGPTFIKFGQTLSTRPDLIGDELADALALLRDRLPPFPGSVARQIVAAELDRPLNEIFQSFDDQPVAAASIAQVHYAVTSGGDEVAVKVLRPGIEARFARDISLLAWLAEWTERLVPRLRRLHFVESVKAFEQTVAFEMDLRYEAAAAAEMADNFANDDWLTIPEIDWQRTAQRVLTLQRIHGIPIDHSEAIVAAGIDPDAVLEKAADAFFAMVFRDGFFHADLHPGNLFVGYGGELIAVDFGITGRVDWPTRKFLGEMLLGFLNRDFRRVAEVHFEIGFVPEGKSLDAFTQACRSIAEPILEKPLHEISIARLLGQLFQVTETFSMEAQPQLLLLQKTMLVAEGVGRMLNSKINMWELSRPLMEAWMRENLGPKARIQDSLGDFADSLGSLPRLMRDAESAVTLLRGRGLKLHPDSLRALRDDSRPSRWFPIWVPWLLVVVLMYLLLHK
jgi:ubiquinone biosynthesis protein